MRPCAPAPGRLPQHLAMSALVAALALLPVPAESQRRPSPDDDDFDPVALMQALQPGWTAPDVSEEALSRHPLGSAGNPVRAQGPSGQRAYLARLRCADGSTPAQRRIGSTGTGPWGFILDIHEVRCKGGLTAGVHMDLYHPGYIEHAPVPGFRMVD